MKLSSVKVATPINSTNRAQPMTINNTLTSVSKKRTKVSLLIFSLLIILLLPIRLLGYDNNISLVDSLPNISELGKRGMKLAGEGHLNQSAQVFLDGNALLAAPEIFLYASLMYAKAGNVEAAASALIRSIDTGMANWNILAKDQALDTIRQAKNWPEIKSKLDSIQRELADPANFQVSVRPLERFLAISPTMDKQDYTYQALEKFVLKGSPGVRDFYQKGYRSVDQILSVVQDSFHVYQELKNVYQLGALDSLGTIVEQYMLAFSKNFENGTYPTVYLMPGIFTSGGTASNVGLFIGVEMSLQKHVPHHSTVDKNILSQMIKGMAGTTFHELMHFQQAYSNADPSTVLYKVIEEGSATFLTTLFTGGNIEIVNAEFLRDEANMKMTLSKFKEEMFTNEISNWVYNDGSQDWPTDIGYQFGAEICRSYYINQPDKRQAIEQLLTSDNLVEIIEGSQYSWLID